MQIRAVTEADVPRVVEAWNSRIRHDRMSSEQFRRVVLRDPNYEQEATAVAESAGEILGLAVAVVRRDVPGRDGGGSEREFGRGFLKVFFVAPGEGGSEAAGALLRHVESYCRTAGKRELMVTEYSGPYLWPGIDVKCEWIRDALVACGYRDVGTIEDVAAELADPRFSAMLERTWAQMPSDVTVVTWESGLLPAMRSFVAEGNMPQWFRAGWESGYQAAMDDTLVLRKGDEVLGWAHYWPGVPRAGFGPILVLPRARGNDYGALLLLECMVRAREGGSETMEAGWANTGFYVRHGWHVTRRYSVLQKEL